MRIEIWADVVCAWAYIGKRRLERALAAPALAGVAVEVVWRPFRIDPTAPGQAVPLEKALRDPLVDGALARCAPGLTPAENRIRVSAIAAEEGLGPTFGAAWRANSHDAHRLLALAFDHGGARLQNTVAEHLMTAHFIDGLDISHVPRLKAIAIQAGFSAGAKLLDTDAAERAVRESLLIGKARGIATSPTIVFANRALAGAQAPETIADFLVASGPQPPAAHTPGHDQTGEVERLRHAESLLDQHDPLGALELLKPLLTAHGQDANVRMLTARAYFASAQLNRARQALEALIADRPDDSYARLLFGRTLQRQGLADQAAVQLRLATAMSPEYLPAS